MIHSVTVKAHDIPAHEDSVENLYLCPCVGSLGLRE